MMSLICLLAAAALQFSSTVGTPGTEAPLRAPSYPLVTIDPFTSAWSPADRLYDATVEHWTGKPFPLLGVLTVDGSDYRFLGKELEYRYKFTEAAARVRPWKGRYTNTAPQGDWTAVDYDDSAWTASNGGYGHKGRKPMTATFMDVTDIWARREVYIGGGEPLYLHATCEGDAEFWLNGVLIASTSSVEMAYFPVPEELLDGSGKAILAAHVHRAEPKAVLDMGLYARKEYEERYPQTATQTSASVLPTRTVYTFECGPVDLELTFFAPLFMDDLELVSRPVNYISYKVVSRDGRRHDVGLRMAAGEEWALNYAIDELASTECKGAGKGPHYLRIAKQDPVVLGRSGDNVRIDWGQFVMAEYGAASLSVGNQEVAFQRPLGKVRKSEGHLMIAYDDMYSIQYFNENLRPYWNRGGDRSIESVLDEAERQYPKLMARAEAFDAELMARAEAAGGARYAELCALAYRQAISAHKLVVSPSGELLFLSKENNSNGCIGTVDVTYPSVPLFLLYNPQLAEGLLNHIFEYSESGRWTKPFPAHDLGSYPLANGQYYPKDMPVEEAGNMLILTAAVCHYEGDASYARRHWETLTTWTKYLERFGLDPEEQLCTDDFAGHLAHNANLSIKAILGIACYGRMAAMLGDEQTAQTYIGKARAMAAQWEEMAREGDHYKLTFDGEGTWSQKYNLVWDKLLGLDIFPAEVRSRELAFYLNMQNRYGLPLDSRKAWTKTDWILWSATMAESKADFEALVAPVWDFYYEQTSRVPMSDWTWTDKQTHAGFKARSVVGGLFIKLLENK